MAAELQLAPEEEKTEGEAPETKEPVDPVEALTDAEPPVVWVIKDAQDNEETYQQRELSFFARAEFIALMADAIDRNVEDGMSVDTLFDIFEKGGMDSDDSWDKVIGVFAKLSSATPTLLMDCICIWLHVPEHQRPWFMQTIKEPLPIGLSDDQVEKMTITFFSQNWGAIEDFFNVRLRRIATKIRDQRAKRAGTASSKRSKRTRRSTPKASKS